MKKITTLLTALVIIAFGFQANAQTVCESAVEIASGHTETGITATVDADGFYAFTYTTGSTVESMSIDFLANEPFNGLGIYEACTGTDYSGLIKSTLLYGVGNLLLVAEVPANTKVYIVLNKVAGQTAIDFDVVKFETSAIICSAPTELTTSNIMDASVDLEWSNGSEGTPASWMIQYGPTDFTVGGGKSADASSNPFNLTNLIAGTDYDFYVKADCGEGEESAWSNKGSFTTTGTAPTCDDPTTLTASSITDVSASLGWMATAPSFSVEYGDKDFSPGTGTIVATADNPYSLTGLTANKEYDYYVTAVCGTLSSNEVGPFSFKTLVTGINTIANDISLNIYPNPTNGVFTLNITTTDVNELNIKVTNTQGQVVFAKSNFDNITTVNEQIDLSENAKGIYFVAITSDKGVATHKVVVK